MSSNICGSGSVRIRGDKRGVTPTSKLITLNFLTPTRIIYSGRLLLNLEFHILIRNLLRRLSLLSYFHCSGKISDIDFKGIIGRARDIKTEDSELRWHDWERYSARQEKRMKMGGFLGKIGFSGDISEFMPYIILGEHLHVGKGTGFGLGRYEII